jgi:hypothetical protein
MTLEAATSAVGYFSKVERLAAAGEALWPVVVPRRACIEVPGTATRPSGSPL